MKQIFTWFPIILTLALIVVMDVIHLGVIHFPLFVLVLIVWSLGLVLWFKSPSGRRSAGM